MICIWKRVCLWSLSSSKNPLFFYWLQKHIPSNNFKSIMESSIWHSIIENLKISIRTIIEPHVLICQLSKCWWYDFWKVNTFLHTWLIGWNINISYSMWKKQPTNFSSFCFGACVAKRVTGGDALVRIGLQHFPRREKTPNISEDLGLQRPDFTHFYAFLFGQSFG